MVHRRTETGIILGASARLWHVGRLGTLRELVYRRDGRTFELRFAAMSAREVLFDWRQIEGTPLPPLHGSIAIGRFGPVGSYLIRASMSLPNDAAGTLLRDSIAASYAQRSLCLLTDAMKAAIR